jgi:hypothetical protein
MIHNNGVNPAVSPPFLTPHTHRLNMRVSRRLSGVSYLRMSMYVAVKR